MAKRRKKSRRKKSRRKPKPKRIYIWSETTGKRVSPGTRKRKLNVSINGQRVYGAVAQAIVARWRETGQATTGQPVKVRPRRKPRGPRKTKKLVAGVPDEFNSPFAKFTENVNTLRPRQGGDMIALIEIEFTSPSPKRGKILPKESGIRPFPLGSMTRKQVEALTRKQIEQMYADSDRKGEFKRVVGIVRLKPRDRRKGIQIGNGKRKRRR